MNESNGIKKINLLEDKSYDSSWANEYNLSSNLSIEVITKFKDNDMIAIVREYDDGSQQMLIDRRDGTVSVTNMVTTDGVEYTGPSAMAEDCNSGENLTSTRSTSYLYDKDTGNLLDKKFETGDPSSVAAMQMASETATIGAGLGGYEVPGSSGSSGGGGGIDILENQKWASGYDITNGFDAAISDNVMDSLKYNSAKLGQSYLEILNLQTNSKPVVASLNKLSLGSHLSDQEANGKLSGAMACINELNDNMADLASTFKNVVDEDYIAEHGNLDAFDEEGREVSVDIQDEFGNHYSSYTDYLEKYNANMQKGTPGNFAYDINKSDYVPYYAKTTTMGTSGGEFAKSTTIVADDYIESEHGFSSENSLSFNPSDFGKAITDCIIDGDFEGDITYSINASYKYYSNGTTFEKYDSSGNVIHKEAFTSNYGVFEGSGEVKVGTSGFSAQGELSFSLLDYQYQYADQKEHITADLDLKIAELYAKGGVTIPSGAGKTIKDLGSGKVSWDDIGKLTEDIVPETEMDAGFNLLHLKGGGSFNIFGVSVGIDGDTQVGWSASSGGLANTFRKSLENLEVKVADWNEVYENVVGDGKADAEMQEYINSHSPSSAADSNNDGSGGSSSFGPDDYWGLH